MTFTTVRGMLCIALCLSLLPVYGSNPAIGLIVADGSFRMDNSVIWDNGTLSPGALVETDQAAAQLQLRGGARARLAAETRARIFESHLSLESGIGQVETSNYRIDAAGLQVSTQGPGIARVKVSDPRHIVVAAQQGEVLVTNEKNVLVAKLESGNELAFENAAAATPITKVSGCLTRANGKLILVEAATGLKAELRGTGLEKAIGSQVEVVGKADTASPSAPETSQIIYVDSMKQISKGGCSNNAAAIGAAGAAAGTAAAAAGLSSPAIVAIVAGVAVSGSLIGLGAVHALPGQSQKHPHTSR